MLWLWLALPSILLWASILFLPWQPWRVREALDAAATPPEADLSDITVLIPARNEAATISHALRALSAQGRSLRVIVVDDRSTDGTANIVRDIGGHDLRVIRGEPLPSGWTGKLWALEQGRAHSTRALTLLLDADIVLAPGLLVSLRRKLEHDRLDLVSLMATLRMSTFWGKLLMPAFVYFFKMLYPFALANDPRHRVAAAAGGCILLRTAMIEHMGGFETLRGALIDDCELARCMKRQGHKTWVGLTRSAHSIRAYDTLANIWNMIARTAYTQLHYSSVLLSVCTAVLAIAFCLPLIGLALPNTGARVASALALAGMTISYLPILRYYDRSYAWAAALPLIGTLYLGMTWTSAIRYWRGQRSQWRGRTYRKDLDSKGY